MTITKKTRLLPVPFVGTRLTVEIPADETDYGIYSMSQTDTTQPIDIDWGDGQSDSCPSGVSRKIHRYAKRGTYEIRISDNVHSLNISTTPSGDKTEYAEVYAPMIRSCVVNGQHNEWVGAHCFYNARNMTRFDVAGSSLFRLCLGSFTGCAALSGELRFPEVNDIPNSDRFPIFEGCPNITRIRFAEKYKDVLTAMLSYKTDPKLGAENAKVSFDL